MIFEKLVKDFKEVKGSVSDLSERVNDINIDLDNMMFLHLINPSQNDFTQALLKAYDENRKIYLSGEMIINESIEITKPIEIIGVNACKIISNTNGNMMNITKTSNVKISQIVFEGDNKCDCGICLTDSNNIVIENNIIQNCNNQDMGGFGISVSGLCDNVTIDNNVIKDIVSLDNGMMRGDGITTWGVQGNLRFSNNKIYNCGRHNMAIATHSNIDSEYNIIVENNLLKNSYLCGLDIEYGKNVIVKNNTFINNGVYNNPNNSGMAYGLALKTNGIDIYSRNIIVDGNYFENSGIACISTENAAHDVVISNNIITKSKLGISANGGSRSDYFTISNNIFKDISHMCIGAWGHYWNVIGNTMKNSKIFLSGSDFKHSVVSNNNISGESLFDEIFFDKVKIDNNNVTVTKGLTNRGSSISGCSISNNLFKGENSDVLGFIIIAGSSQSDNLLTNNIFDGKMQYGIRDNQGWTDENITSAPDRIKTFNSNIYAYTT